MSDLSLFKKLVKTFLLFIWKGKKELLLNSLLGQTVASTAKPSMARQRLMEEERLRAVEAYRQLKKQKQQQLEARAGRVGKPVSWSDMPDRQLAALWTDVSEIPNIFLKDWNILI